jgi:hypothetical protein
LDEQRTEIAQLIARLDLPLQMGRPPTVIVSGEVLHSPAASELARAQRQRPPRRLRRFLVTGAAAATTVVAIAAGGWQLTRDQSAVSDTPAPAPATTALVAAPTTSPAPTTSQPKESVTPTFSPTPRTPPATKLPQPEETEPSAASQKKRAPLPVSPVQWGHITNDNSDLCLAVPAASRQAGKTVNQYPCGDYSDHYWQAQQTSADAQSRAYYRIVNYNSRQCLDVADSSTDATAPVVQSLCRESEAQYWRLEAHPRALSRCWVRGCQRGRRGVVGPGCCCVLRPWWAGRRCR